MASDVVIRAERVGKQYIIGHETERERYTALRDVAARTARNVWKRAVDAVRGRPMVRGETTEEFWALKDVSFEVKRGEVLGIIGRNGAGKSTLLKILSRITEPSEGRVTITGRVASLLEVGTGFHPELTGRENIYLNGAILGMNRAEIRRKFDEILDFSGVEKFIDTPVKRYSSGMHVRLAFAVAAHLEPEILVIDEILAVGDAEFQKKCLGKMSEVTTRGGRTILFVSHNMAAVAKLCARVLLLNRGRVQNVYGSAEAAVSVYLKGNEETSTSTWYSDGSLPSNDYFNPLAMAVTGQGMADLHDPLTIEIHGQLVRNDRSLVIALAIYSSDNSLLFWTTSRDQDAKRWLELSAGPLDLAVQIPIDILNEGDYYAELVIFLHHQQYLIREGAGPKVCFSVRPKAYSEFWDFRRTGHFAVALPWRWRQPACRHESPSAEITT
jgi:lipopolysaccharide transport system ATP-binding protein